MKQLAPLIFVLLFAACEGPEGPEGPVGPMGPEGPAGATVITRTYLFSDGANYKEGFAWIFEFDEPRLTREVIDGGLLLAYTDQGTRGQAWVQMPANFTADIEAVFTLSPVYIEGVFGVIIGAQCLRREDPADAHEHEIYDACEPDTAPGVGSLVSNRIKLVIVPSHQVAAFKSGRLRVE